MTDNAASRPSFPAVDLMVLLTVVLWSLAVVAARYAIHSGFAPVAFGALRQAGSASILAAVCFRRERALGLGRGALPLAVTAILLGYVNQFFLVYALQFATASTVGVVQGTNPILTALIAALVGTEQLSRRLALAAVLSFGGVGLVSATSGGIRGTTLGVGLALLTALTWSGYSVAVGALTATRSALRVSAVVVVGFAPLLGLTAGPELGAAATWHVGWASWACLAAVAVGSACCTAMWFKSIDHVGASRATLVGNLQLLIVLFGVALLSEHLSAWTVAGGVVVAIGVAVGWRAGPRTYAAP